MINPRPYALSRLGRWMGQISLYPKPLPATLNPTRTVRDAALTQVQIQDRGSSRPSLPRCSSGAQLLGDISETRCAVQVFRRQGMSAADAHQPPEAEWARIECDSWGIKI